MPIEARTRFLRRSQADDLPQPGRRSASLPFPELVDAYWEPTAVKIAKKRSEDVVYSKSRRQKLGGAVTTVYLTTDGKFRVEGVDGADWGTYDRFSGKYQALEVARTGPPEEEPEATTDDEATEEATEAEAEDENETEAEAA